MPETDVDAINGKRSRKYKIPRYEAEALEQDRTS